MVKIATWNVNSIKMRLGHLVDWLNDAKPDIVLLQEIKTAEDSFPRLEIESLGYKISINGQKTYNGVAILAKQPITVVANRLPGGDGDVHSRYLEAVVGGVRVASIYAPNGNPVESEKFGYKLEWLERLHRHAKDLLATREPVVFGGDFNVTVDDGDVHAPEAWKNDALCRPESRDLLRRLLYLGFTDAIRALSPEVGRYTWWDYRAGAWQRDEGLRIDHLLLSPQAADRLTAADIDRKPRGREKASDHTPVWCELRA
ncbi:MAG: exodeoxyribonuclease III [Rhodospirillales bacterium]|nr:exodeoxyribonuclease III [Rhodospirillales bacterium]